MFAWKFEKVLMRSVGQVVCMTNKFKFVTIALTDAHFQISIMYVMVNVKQYLLRKDLTPENYYEFEKKKSKIKYSRHARNKKTTLLLETHVRKAPQFEILWLCSLGETFKFLSVVTWIYWQRHVSNKMKFRTVYN